MWGSFNENEDMAWDQLDALMRLGVNFLDTAEMYPVAWNYGKTTETWMGNWLSKRSEEGKVDRKKLYIATKVNCSAVGTPPMPGRDKIGVHAYEEDIVMHACKSSIARLKCEYIDLYQFHWPCRDTPVFGCAHFYPGGHNRPNPFVKEQGGLESFERQVLGVKKLFDAGLIRNWGLSNENAYGITMFCMACDKLGVPRPVSCQNDFSLLNRTYEGDTWEAAYRFGVVGLPYGVLAGGFLSGKYLPDSKYADTDPDRPLSKCRHKLKPDFQPRYAWPAAVLASEKYVAIAEDWGLTPAELALAWARDRQCNGSIIIGTASVKQVEDCVNAFKLEKLPEQLMNEVDDIFEEFRNPTRYYAIKESAQLVGTGKKRKVGS